MTMETGDWAKEQFGECQLGDKRRTRRAVKVAERVVQNPSASFPVIFENWTDLKAAYDLFDCPDVTFEALLEPHWRNTRHRPSGRYLVLGDTTDVDFGIQRDIAGTGPTGNGGGNGFLLHSGLMVRADNEEVIGLAGQTIHHRKEAPKDETTYQRLKRPRESEIWGKVIDQVGRPSEGVEVVHVLDRGADNFEVYCHLIEQQVDWVVRVAQTKRHILTPAGDQVALRDYLSELPVHGEYELELRARPKQPARTAKLEVRFGRLAMPAPKHKSAYVKQVNPGAIHMWVIWVREVRAPKGAEPLEWILYTSLPVERFDDAWEVIGYYEKRWIIEEWHKALKTGCRVTDRQLKTSERLEAMAGLMSVVAVRLLQLKTVARIDPDRPAKKVVPEWWVDMLARICKLPKKGVMTVRQFYRTLAKLGGFLGRKHDGEPGWITIWRGWDKFYLMMRGAVAVQRHQLQCQK